MAEASIPVDLWNPGQVFACLGFLEAADQLLGRAEGAFDWCDPADIRFRLRAAGNASPVMRVLEFLEQADAVAEAVEGSANFGRWKKAWAPAPRPRRRDEGYPYPDPSSPATLVCALTTEIHVLRLCYWGDTPASGRDNAKFWGGSAGQPGAILARKALELIRGNALAHSNDPFSFKAPQSSSFRLDWRRDYIAIDAGYSLNKHENITTIGYPLVELLAALGLSNSRPRPRGRKDDLTYVYGVIGRDESAGSLWLPLPLLRAALGSCSLPFPSRRFRMHLGWPAKKDQDRVITTVTEEHPQ